PKLVRAADAKVDAKPLTPRSSPDEGGHHLSVLTAVPKPPSGEPEEKPPRRVSPDLDPRLVRAALGGDVAIGVAVQDPTSSEEEVPLDPSVPAKPRKERTQELRLEDLETTEDDEDDEVPLDPSVPAKPRKEPTQEL